MTSILNSHTPIYIYCSPKEQKLNDNEPVTQASHSKAPQSSIFCSSSVQTLSEESASTSAETFQVFKKIFDPKGKKRNRFNRDNDVSSVAEEKADEKVPVLNSQRVGYSNIKKRKPKPIAPQPPLEVITFREFIQNWKPDDIQAPVVDFREAIALSLQHSALYQKPKPAPLPDFESAFDFLKT